MLESTNMTILGLKHHTAQYEQNHDIHVAIEWKDSGSIGHLKKRRNNSIFCYWTEEAVSIHSQGACR